MYTFDIHALFSTKAMIILIVLTLIISLVATFIVKPGEYEKSRFHVFMSILASVAVLLIGLSLIVSSLALEEQQEINRATITSDATTKLWDESNKLIVSSKNARDVFIKSLFLNNLDLYNLPLKNEQETRLSILEEQYIAMHLIQAWEYWLSLRHLLVAEDLEWLSVFVQWAQSPYLKKYFIMLKNIYSSTTIELAELLFEYAKKLPVPTADPKEYPIIVSKMLNDPRLIQLFKVPIKEGKLIK